MFSTIKEWEKDRAQRRYQRRRNRHIRERDTQRWNRELEGFNWSEFDIQDWGQDWEQDQGEDQEPLVYGSQKRQYSDPQPRERRYPARKRQLTMKAAALIV